MVRYPQGGTFAGELGVRVVVTGGGRDDLVPDRQDGLEQPGHPGRGLGVPEVALHRADRGGRGGGVGRPAGLGEGPQLGGVADRRAGAVALEVGHRLDAEPGRGVSPFECQPVAAGLRSGDAALAVRGVAPAGDRGVPEPLLGLRVLIAHQDHHPAALARPEAVRALVVDPHLARGQRAGLGEADHLERVDGEVHAADHGHVQPPVDQRVAGGGDREQRGGASTVDGEPAALEVEVVADPAGDGVGQTTGQGVLADRREGALVALLQARQETGQRCVVPALFAQRGADRAAHVRPAQAHQVGPAELAGEGVADDDTGVGLAEPGAEREAGVLQGPRGGVQRQPVRHVGGPVGGAGHPVLDPVELEALDDGGLGRVELVRRRRVGVVVVLGAHPLVRQAPEGAAAGEYVLPELAR